MTYVIFLFVKNNLGELTPDEILFTSGLAPVDDWSLKYLITLYVISSLTEINQFLYPFFLILLGVCTYGYAYKEELKSHTIGKIGLLIAFLLPSTIYFSTAYLRDIFLFLLSLLLIYSYKRNKISVRSLFIFGGIAILRPEAGLLIFLSFIFVSIFTKKDKIILSINKYSTPIVLLFSWLLLFALINTDIFWEFLYETVNRYEKSTDGFSVFEVDITKSNVLMLGFVNWFAYYASFLFKDSFSLFSYFMLLDSILIGFLFLRGIFLVKKRNFKYDKIYQISYVLVLSTLFVSLPESLPETMYRHRMAYLPFLLYLNFSRPK